MIEAKEVLTGDISVKESLAGELNIGVEVISPSLIDLEVTPSKEKQTFKHEGSYGYDNVVVNAMPDEYVVPNGELEIIENGTYDVKEYASANINVPTGEPTPPETGFLINEYDGDGYATKITTYGSSIPSSAFFSQNTSLANYLTKNLTEVSFNDVVTSIGSSAFKNATNLVNIGSIENLTSLGEYGFQNCSNLILKSVDKLGYFTQTSFSGCNSIVQLSMEGATMIAGNGTSSGAFYNCKGLKAVWIGSEVTSIGRYAFSGCSNLTKIFIDLPRATVETWAYYSYAFMNNANKTGIIVCNDDEGFITKEEFDATTF